MDNTLFNAGTVGKHKQSKIDVLKLISSSGILLVMDQLVNEPGE
jgi:hypothetical protein